MKLLFALEFGIIVLLSSSLHAQKRSTDTTAKPVSQSQRAATAGPSIDIYRRNLQKLYVERLISLVQPSQSKSSSSAALKTSSVSKSTDVLSILKGHIKNLAMQIKLAQTRMTDTSSKLHLQDVYGQLSDALSSKSAE